MFILEPNANTNTLEYWSARWTGGQTPWKNVPEDYQGVLDWIKQTSGSSLEIKNVLVPLSGDSRVVDFLAGQGIHVVANEFVEDVCQTLQKNVEEAGVAQNVRILQGDFFELVAAEAEGSIDFVWDRASLVALHDVREKYAQIIDRVVRPGGAIYLSYVHRRPDVRQTGPPYHTAQEEIQSLYPKYKVIFRGTPADDVNAAAPFAFHDCVLLKPASE